MRRRDNLSESNLLRNVLATLYRFNLIPNYTNHFIEIHYMPRYIRIFLFILCIEFLLIVANVIISYQSLGALDVERTGNTIMQGLTVAMCISILFLYTKNGTECLELVNRQKTLMRVYCDWDEVYRLNKIYHKVFKCVLPLTIATAVICIVGKQIIPCDKVKIPGCGLIVNMVCSH